MIDFNFESEDEEFELKERESLKILQRVHEKNQVTKLSFFCEQFAKTQDDKLNNRLLPKVDLRFFEDLFAQGKLTPNLNDFVGNLMDNSQKTQSSKHLFNLTESNFKVYKCKFCHKIFTKGCSLGIF